MKRGLAESESALVALLNAAPDGILLVDRDGRIAFGNDAALLLFGYSREELVNEPVDILVPARHRSRHRGQREVYGHDPVRRPMGIATQFRGRRQDGSEFPAEISLAPISTTGESMTVTIVRDVTEQRESEAQRVRYARSQAIEEIVASLDAIIWEAAGPNRESMSYFGGGGAAFMGYSSDEWSAPGFWLSVVHPDDRIAAIAFAQSARERTRFELEYRLIDADGLVHQVRDIVSVRHDGDNEVVRASGVIVDITERREIEARLVLAQRMEAVGRLAGGIAHDFNNLLTIISGYAHRLAHREDMAAGREAIDQIIVATDRAAELTKQLLAFARRGQNRPEPLDVSEAARALEPMLRRIIPGDIVFDFDLDSHLPAVLIDRTELEQIVMNLIINASDAMEAGGTLTVTTRPFDVSAVEGSQHGVAAGDAVALSITDTGVGIAPEICDRIFDPFFTTKPDGGTGMGLATVFGIVAQAGGWVDVRSTLGEGATFRVVLPVAVLVEPGEETVDPLSVITLLVVEDEPALRRLMVSTLKEDGYRVLDAGTGLDAVAVAERWRGPLDLLITDVVMPGLSGPELADALRTMRPNVAVLFISGYSDSRLVGRGLNPAGFDLLVKPFTPDQLLTRVREMTIVSIGEGAGLTPGTRVAGRSTRTTTLRARGATTPVVDGEPRTSTGR